MDKKHQYPRRYDEALQYFRRALELESDFALYLEMHQDERVLARNLEFGPAEEQATIAIFGQR